MSVSENKPIIPPALMPNNVSSGLLEKKAITNPDKDGNFAKKTEGKTGKESATESNVKADIVNKDNTLKLDTLKLTNSTDKTTARESVQEKQGAVQRMTNKDVSSAADKTTNPNPADGALVGTHVQDPGSVKMTQGKLGQNPNHFSHLMEDGQTFASNTMKGMVSSHVGRSKKKSPYDEDDEDGQNQRRRKKAAFQPSQQQAKKPLTVLEGSKVGSSQDMFVSSSYSQQKISNMKVQKTITEQIKEFYLTDDGLFFYDTVYANYNHKEKNGIGQNMQKDIFAGLIEYVGKTDDVLSPQYKKLLRQIIQGSMKAGYDTHLEMKDLAKILISGLMATSPHDDNPEIMAQTIKMITSEIMFGKLNIGYNMRDAASYIGAASYTLALYYKEYQNDIKFNKELEKFFHEAFAEAIWSSTGEMTAFSTAYAKTNIEHFMNARNKEEEAVQKSLMKNMLLSPFKKVLNM
ncbi:MAG: hypothetical protein U0457_01305 [Candidatus Sericytochromatia bacterium]